MTTLTPAPSNNNDDEQHPTILAVLQQRSYSMPDHKIFSWVNGKGKETASLTYLQLWTKASLVANHILSNKAIAKGDRVMVCYPPGLEYLAGLFGCMLAGVVPCSVYPPNPNKFKTDMKQFLDKAADAGAKFSLTTLTYRRAIAAKMLFVSKSALGTDYEVKWITTDNLHGSANAKKTKHQHFCPTMEDVAFIQYTSGSTGHPKGVVIPHRTLVGCCRELTTYGCKIENMEEAKGLVFVSWVPQYHDFGLIAFFINTVFSAFHGIAFSPLDFLQNPLLWHDLIVKHKADITEGPNFAYGLVVKRFLQRRSKQQQQGATDVNKSWDSLRCACVGAEPIDPQVLQSMKKVLGVRERSIIIGYGMAETGVFTSGGDGHVRDGIAGCGKIDSHDTLVRVVNDGCVVEEGTEGEIWVQSSMVALGYWNKDELTEKTFKNQLKGHDGYWLATGDLGKVIDGELYVTGRSKDVIIINGKNYYPVDFERTLEESYPKLIRPGCNVAFQFTSTGVGIAAEIRQGVTEFPDTEDIRRLLGRVHGVTVSYVCLLKCRTIPKTTSGKLKRIETRKTSIEGGWDSRSVLRCWQSNFEAEPRQQDLTSPAASLVERGNETQTTGSVDIIEATEAPLQALSVIVVGGGASGLSCALTLARQGHKVTVLERNDIVGGHARHVEVFGGHQRNPAFGFVFENQWPNVCRLWEELGVETISCGKPRSERFFLDGTAVEGPSLQEGRRFIREMSELFESGIIDRSVTIGEYLDANGYDDTFLHGFFLGNVIFFFAGLSIQEYLDFPLHIIAWMFLGAIKNLNNTMKRVRNKEYMEKLVAELTKLGVVVRTSVDPKLVGRTDTKVTISIGDEIMSANKLVVATQPNHAADFLGGQITDAEMILRSFTVGRDTVVLHQDQSMLSVDDPDSFVHIRLPCNKGDTLSRRDTVDFTTVANSDSDGKTPILTTYSYANCDNLLVEGPVEKITLTHVRHTTRCFELRGLLKYCQGQRNTYFVGGWTRGMMLHEDAVVSGIDAANMIHEAIGGRPQSILERMLPEKLPLAFADMQKRVDGVSNGVVASRNQSTDVLAKRMCQVVKASVGRDVVVGDRLDELGLSSMEISNLHPNISEILNVDPDNLPIHWLFDGEVTIAELAAKIVSSDNEGRKNAEFLQVEGSEEVLLGADVGESAVFDQAHPSNAPTDLLSKHRLPNQQPLFVKLVDWIVQCLAILIPPLFVGFASLPIAAFIVWQREWLHQQSTWTIGLLLPWATLVFFLTATLSLIGLKWILVGRQRPGNRSVWGGAFARRWIVRQCAQICWNYTYWAWLEETELLCIVHRLLGCHIGEGVGLGLNLIEDYDLVTIGHHSSVKATLNTEYVSLGVQTLQPISIGEECSIAEHVQIEQGVTIESGVRVDMQTMVPRGSVLPSSSQWQGLPAYAKNEDRSSSSVRAKDDAGYRARKTLFDCFRLFVVFVLSPYLKLFTVGISFGIGYSIWNLLGFWGLAPLIWVPSAASMMSTVILVVGCKWMVLGRVKEGSWPLYGSFHRRKWFVDHMVNHHFLAFLAYGLQSGCPLLTTTFTQLTILQWLGVKCGKYSGIVPSLYTCYDLLSLSTPLFGGGSAVYTFEKADDRLHGRRVMIGDEVYLGTQTVVLPGTTIAERSAVAGYSVMQGDLQSDELCVGNRQVHKRTTPPPIGEAMLTKRFNDFKKIGATAAFVSYIALVLVILLIGLLYTLDFLALPSSNIVRASSLSAFLSLLVGVIMPLYGFAVIVATKVLVVGHLVQDEDEHGGQKMNAAWMILNDFGFRLNFALVHGTWLEVALVRLLGAHIGQDVYMDGVKFYEPDLLSIGNNVSLNKGASVCPHQFKISKVQFGALHIGDRCTVGSNTSLHGCDIVDDDTEIEAFSMPLIGTHLKGGKWRGYPARKIEKDPSRTPLIPTPKWFICLTNPVSSLLGLFWKLSLLLTVQLSGRPRSKPSKKEDVSLPHELEGSYSFVNSCMIDFADALWLKNPRCLIMPRATYVRGNQHANSWWNWASYYWAFDGNRTIGRGRVKLGFWFIPLSILSATLTREGRDWVWAHRWFGGEWEEVARLQLSCSSVSDQTSDVNTV